MGRIKSSPDERSGRRPSQVERETCMRLGDFDYEMAVLSGDEQTWGYPLGSRCLYNVDDHLALPGKALSVSSEVQCHVNFSFMS